MKLAVWPAVTLWFAGCVVIVSVAEGGFAGFVGGCVLTVKPLHPVSKPMPKTPRAQSQSRWVFRLFGPKSHNAPASDGKGKAGVDGA